MRYEDALDLLSNRLPSHLKKEDDHILPPPTDAHRENVQRIGRLEGLLRLEDLVSAHRECSLPMKGNDEDVEAFYACQAELALRSGDRQAYAEAIERAQWRRGVVGPSAENGAASQGSQGARACAAVQHRARLHYVTALSVARWPREEDAMRWALDVLSMLRESRLWSEMPGRQAEWLCHRARIHFHLGEAAAVEECLSLAERMPSDRRSTAVLAESRAELVPCGDTVGKEPPKDA